MKHSQSYTYLSLLISFSMMVCYCKLSISVTQSSLRMDIVYYALSHYMHISYLSGDILLNVVYNDLTSSSRKIVSCFILKMLIFTMKPKSIIY